MTLTKIGNTDYSSNFFFCIKEKKSRVFSTLIRALKYKENSGVLGSSAILKIKFLYQKLLSNTLLVMDIQLSNIGTILPRCNKLPRNYSQSTKLTTGNSSDILKSLFDIFLDLI